MTASNNRPDVRSTEDSAHLHVAPLFAQLGHDSSMWVEVGRFEGTPRREAGRTWVELGRDSSMWLDEMHTAKADEASEEIELAGSGTEDRSAITKKMSLGKKNSAQAGWHQGGATPFGYLRRFDPVEGRAVLVKDEREAPIVAEIFQAYVAIGSLEKVRLQLEAAGMRNSYGRGWSRSSLGFLLSNRTYTGLVKYGGEGHMGRHEPIVSADLFEAARQVRAKQRKRREEKSK